MNAPIYYVGGSKGGVGKSKLSFALINYLRENGKKVLVMDTDTSNPDVFKAHHKEESDYLVCKITDLDVADGWIKLVNDADEFPDHIMVVNSAARSNEGIKKYGAMLKETLGELDRKLVVFWVINRQRDSVELLRGFLNSFPDALIHICRNMYYGPPDKFELYNKSSSRPIVERNGKTLDFPELADRVADLLYCERTSIQAVLTDTETPIGDRAELRRWKGICAALFDSVIGEKPNDSGKN